MTKFDSSTSFSSIEEIELYILEENFFTFSTNSMMRFACIKQMEIIGEAANHITKETTLKFPQIEWVQIVGMRNILIHEYFGVDSSLIWDIIKNDIPVLKGQIESILLEIE